MATAICHYLEKLSVRRYVREGVHSPRHPAHAVAVRASHLVPSSRVAAARERLDRARRTPRVCRPGAELLVVRPSCGNGALTPGQRTSLQLQDDVIVAPNFWYHLRRMIEDVPNGVIGLEAVHPNVESVTGCWYKTFDCLIGVAYVVPTTMLRDFLEWRSKLRKGAIESVSEDTLAWRLVHGDRPRRVASGADHHRPRRGAPVDVRERCARASRSRS